VKELVCSFVKVFANKILLCEEIEERRVPLLFSVSV
jgi:hypothetical protein